METDVKKHAGIYYLQAKLEQMATTDFFGNLGQIIHDILGTANKIYRDMADVGDHKKRAKYRYSLQGCS